MNDEKREQVNRKRRPPGPKLTAEDIEMQLIWLEMFGTPIDKLHASIEIFRESFK